MTVLFVIISTFCYLPFIKNKLAWYLISMTGSKKPWFLNYALHYKYCFFLSFSAWIIGWGKNTFDGIEKE